MTTSAAGSRMTSPPPDLTAVQAEELVHRHFGLSGDLTPLSSERDLNFRLTTSAGSFVVKFANAAEPHEVTNFQTEALLHIASRDPGMPVPRVVRSLDDRVEIVLESGSVMRLLTWVEGRPVAGQPASPALRNSLGRTAARLTRALEGYAHPASGHVLLWDIKNASQLRPLLPAVGDEGLREICSGWLDRFDAEIAPALPDLPWQVVHADLNPHNVLTADDDPTRVTGILDFGDMARTPRVCDLAVACSYHADPADPVATMGDLVAGWHAVLPLNDRELALVLDLAAIRMVTTAVLSTWRAERDPANAAYFLRNLPASRAGLTRLSALDRDTVRDRLSHMLLPEDET